jgi:hypothetical protein
MKKLLWGSIATLIVLVAILFLARNIIARVSVEYGAKKITGFPLTIGSVDLELFSSKVDVHDLKLMNPPEFQEPMFVDMPQLFVDYRFGTMISGTPHINSMLINIKQLVVVKNSKGESNAQKLKGVVSSGGGSSKSSKYAIDKLHIHIGTVTIKDFSRAKPYEHSTPLNIDVTYPNISDSTDITRLVLLTVMSQMHIPDIGVNTDELKKNLSNVTEEAGKTFKGAADGVGGFFNNLQKSGSSQNNK